MFFDWFWRWLEDSRFDVLAIGGLRLGGPQPGPIG
jgi:hypothetical protein